MPKYSRIQLNLYCQTCDVKFQVSIYYGATSIWNNKDAGRIAAWQPHETHDTELTYKFIIGDKDERSYGGAVIDMPSSKRGRPPK